MLDGLVPDLAPRLMIAIGGVMIAFLVLIAVLFFLRRRNSALFVKGGRAREHRLLVMDAAAVDAKRRLVLIRRDDTEHLIMIGGPTDIVIETGIAGQPSPRTAQAAQAQRTAEAPRAAETQRAAAAPAAQPPRPAQQAPVTATVVPMPTRPAQAETRRPDGERRQNRDQVPNQRRLERQAARAAEAAKAAAASSATSGSPSSGATTAGAASAAVGATLQNQARATSEVRSADTMPAEKAADAPPDVQSRTPAAAQPVQAQGAGVDQPRDRNQSTGQPVGQPAARDNRNAQRDALPDSQDLIKHIEEQLEAGRAESQRAETARADAARAEASRVEAARLEAERAAAAKADAERAEAVRAEAARLETIRIEAQRAEAARLEAERAERQRQEAERQDAERAEAARRQASEAEAQRAEAARQESERVAAARAEAMARFEAARRSQSEQRQPATQPSFGQPQVERSQNASAAVVPPVQPRFENSPARQYAAEQSFRDMSFGTAATPVVAAAAEDEVRWPVMDPPTTGSGSEQDEVVAEETDAGAKRSQERLATDFEKLLEAELEADGILDRYVAPSVAGERRDSSAPAVNADQRNTPPVITGAMPGPSIEQDMARRLGEISLNKKDAF